MLKNFFSKKGKIINKLYHFSQEILSPKYCLSCFNYNRNYLCKKCFESFKLEINFSCLECGRRVAPICPSKNHSQLIKFLISFSDYENVHLRHLVILGKSKAFEIFTDLGSYFGKELKKFPFQDYFLVPVPLTKKKFLERGFNQSEIFAKAISQETGQKIFSGLLKIKDTQDQVNLSYTERLKNLKGVFILKEQPPSRLILIDDIKTTGTTLKECARVLKNGGASEILALTILR